ncbi:putative SCAN domain-containing protein SCAND2P [Cavia porcellus]|uniref:putative SCAN domain-containing protein SCAND2P n=1 Tax=Cavia porcellus TaxID=10141 RepID=UPI000C877951|nr:putative SCAN domain-containing protein SCAND2P [Cavia porcellus]
MGSGARSGGPLAPSVAGCAPGTPRRHRACSVRGRRSPAVRSSAAASRLRQGRAPAASARPPQLSAPSAALGALRSPRPRPPLQRARVGPLPREDGCCPPGPQLLPLLGALLRPRTLLSPAAGDGQE